MRDKNKKTINNILIVVACITLFFIITLGSFTIMVYYKSFYFSEYQKNNVYNKINETEAQNITDNLFKFMKGSEKLQYFTENEKSHLEDVKKLINVFFVIYYLSTVVFLLSLVALYYLNNKNAFDFMKILSKILIISSIAVLAFLVVLFLMSVFYFDLLFMGFHKIFFPQGNYLFDSSTLLITLFPGQFFFDIFVRIILYSVLQAIVFLIIGIWIHGNLNKTEMFKKE